MDELRNELTITIRYCDIMKLMTDIEPRFNFIFQSLYSSFDKKEALNNHNLNRYIVLSAQLLFLQYDDFLQYTDEKEVSALVDKLENERNVLRNTIEELNELKNNDGESKRGNNDNLFDKFDRRYELLSNV